MQKEPKWLDIPAPGLGGWNSFLESESIQDGETPDIENMVYDGGFLSPRPGSELFAAKPAGESGAPHQTIVANTSDGIEYIIAIYGGNKFYLYHPDTSAWVRINQTYVPASTNLLYGYAVWNNGRGDDRLYFGNGTDNDARWDLCVSTAASAATAGATTLTLTDASRFPASGTVVIVGDSSTFTEPYTSKTGNQLNLTNTLNGNVSAGAAVVMDVVEKGSMQKGRIFVKHGSRLFVMNRYGAETAGYYTGLNDPEDFSTGSGIADASSFVIADGYGQITGAHDFGEFLVIEKEDSFHRFRIIPSEDLGSKLDEIKPILSGRSLGPIGMETTVKMQNQLLYPTRTEGIFAVVPTTSGGDTSIDLSILSQNIQSYVLNSINFDNARVTAYKQNALWAVALTGATENTKVLLFDKLRGKWSRLANWAVKDWAYANGNLYYLESGTGDMYRCFTKSYHDDNNPYPCYFYTKRFNFGAPAVPKTQDLIYVHGYMTPATEFFIDVLFNEGGILGTKRYRFATDETGLLVSEPLTNALGEFVLGTIASGYVSTMEIGDVVFFRGYMAIPTKFGFYNIQCKVSQNKEAFFAITNLSFNPDISMAIPSQMLMSPVQ